MAASLIGTGSCLPKKVITNTDITKVMDTSDEWIVSRTGIHTRRKIVEESCLQLAQAAAEEALEDARVRAEDIDLIIVATLTPDTKVPAMSFMLQDRLGAVNAVCFDVNSACTGFVTGLITANAYMEAGLSRCALIVGVEAISRILDYSDRSTGMLFGDGAGAAVVRHDSEGSFNCVQGSLGHLGGAIYCENESESRVSMDGRAVFEFAVKTVPAAVKQLMDAYNMSPENIDYFLLHQANKRISDSVIKRLGIPEEKFPFTIDHTGNTSAASIPILLDECRKKGLLGEASELVLAGFGGGLSYGVCSVGWRNPGPQNLTPSGEH